jgi:phage terminase large subunit
VSYARNPGQERMRRDLLTSGKRFCLVYGGSRSGKTFELVGTVIERALLAPGSRHLIVRQEGIAAKRAIAQGTWGAVLPLRFPGLKVEWNEFYGRFALPNGSEVWIGGLNDDKALEKILGNEYATIYVNEASEVRYSARAWRRP